MQQELVVASSRRARSFTPVQVNLEERAGLAGRRTALPFVLFSTRYQLLSVVAMDTPRQMAGGMWNLALCPEKNVGLLNITEQYA